MHFSKIQMTSNSLPFDVSWMSQTHERVGRAEPLFLFINRELKQRQRATATRTSQICIFKAWPSACNIAKQHHATLLGTTCCVRLTTLLRYVACVWPVHSTHVATSRNNVARCCVEMLRAFGQSFSEQKQ